MTMTITKIIRGLYLGNALEVEKVRGNGEYVLLDARGFVSRNKDPEDNIDIALALARVIKDNLANGYKVLVFCGIAEARSPYVIATYLMEHENHTYESAYGLMRDLADQVRERRDWFPDYYVKSKSSRS